MQKHLRRSALAAMGIVVVALGFTLGPVSIIGAQTVDTPAPTPAAAAGDVKIHDITDATTDTHDNPKPCDPVLVSFNFTVNSQYTYEFLTQPGGVIVLGPTTVTVTTDPQQEPKSGDFRPPLLKGQQYKLVWDFGASIGDGPKSKVFQIPTDCVDPPVPGTTATPTVVTPKFTG